MMWGRSSKVKFTKCGGADIKFCLGRMLFFFQRYLRSSNNPGIFSNGICLALKIKICEHAVLFGNGDWVCLVEGTAKEDTCWLGL